MNGDTSSPRKDKIALDSHTVAGIMIDLSTKKETAAGTAMSELKSRGFTEVFLWVLEENNIARRFYEKNGFKCSYDYLVDNIGGRNLREVRYVYQFH